MRLNFPLLRLDPVAAGRLQRDHDRAVRKLAAAERLNAALQARLRADLGTEALWQIQREIREQLLLEDLLKERAA